MILKLIIAFGFPLVYITLPNVNKLKTPIAF